MTEFQNLVHAAERGILYEKGTGGDFTPAWALCDWLEERGDPRVPTIRYTIKHCEDHSQVLLGVLARPRPQRMAGSGYSHLEFARNQEDQTRFIETMIAHHNWLASTNKRLMLLLANREVPTDPVEFEKTKSPCWMDAVPPKE